MSDDKSSQQGLPDLSSLIPGKELEKAAADISSEAGKSIIRGIAKLSNAAVGPWIARREAYAEAARLSIETEAEIDRNRVLAEERRKQELKEVDHQEVRMLAERRLRRLVINLAREESNLEAIATRSLHIADNDPDRANAREIGQDWIFKFSDYAQDVSDMEVQELWSRILSSAAIEGKQLLSPAALQAMSLLDKKGASDFEKFCRVYASFDRFYPVAFKANEREIQDIDLGNLIEVGLIIESKLQRYSFEDFDLARGDVNSNLTFHHPIFSLTQRGTQIANAVFDINNMRLSDEIQESYIRALFLGLKGSIPCKFTPKLKYGGAPFTVILREKPNDPDAGEDNARVFQLLEPFELSERVWRLFRWAGEQFSLTTYPP